MTDDPASNIGILFDLMFENDAMPRDWQWESDWSPPIPRATLESLERKGFVEIDRSYAADWRVKQTSAGERAALAQDSAA